MKGVTLEALFEFQDLAAVRNAAESATCRLRLDFVRKSVSVLADVFGSLSFPAPKQHTLRVLGGDALTALVTSVRVGLWGNLPEAAGLLRSSLETTSILAAAVEGNSYETIATEIAAARLKRHNYKKSVRALGERGSRIEHLHGRLSDLGAHSTGTRLKFASYERDGERFDRLAAALDPVASELALAMAPDVCLHLLESCGQAFQQDGVDFAQGSQVETLRTMFESCKRSDE